MRWLARWSWVFAAFCMSGCTEVSTPPDRVELVRTIRNEFTSEVIEGVRMCQSGNCDVSDADGRVALDVPANEKITWTLEKDGYGSILIGSVFPGPVPAVGTTTMFPDSHLVDQARRVDIMYPPTDTGMIFVFLGVTFPGATFELIDATGTPYYSDEDWNWSLDLTETVSRGEPVPLIFNHGDGGFVEVPPGEVQFEMGGTANRCTAFGGWPGDDINRIRVPVREGFITYAIVACPLPPS